MGMRFRKSKNFGGFRVNLSKSGIGWSVGGKGIRYTKKANGGTRTTLSVPGTGVSYVTETGSKPKRFLNVLKGFWKIILFPLWFPFVFLYWVYKIMFLAIYNVIKIWRKKDYGKE